MEHGQGLIVRQSGKKLIRGTEGQVNRMSDDLISKKAVIALIDKLGYINVSSRDNFNANRRMDKVRQEVVKLPTAFDTEKVIEELDKCKQIMLSPASKDCFGEECRENDCMACVFNKAIEIVEKGGV